MILFGICASEEVSKEIRDEAWTQFRKRWVSKRGRFPALVANTFATNNNSDKNNSKSEVNKSRRYFVSECIRSVQRTGSQEVSASLLRVVFQIWSEYRREILEILDDECTKMIESNVDTYDDEDDDDDDDDDDDAQSISKNGMVERVGSRIDFVRIDER